jgi:acetyl-CoA carboxylase biotin carboxyl carrier protein
MNLKEIKEIVTLMNENDLTEVEIEREGEKLRLKKSGSTIVETFVRPPQFNLPPPVVPPVPLVPPAKTDKEDAGLAPGQKAITSPMVGTFYRAPSPDAPPFVEVGQVIEVGKVVCIVEAMKLMNEIKSEIRGKVVRVAVENAEPVEFGQTLFVVEPQ